MITDKMSDMEIFKEVWSERGAVHGYMERLIPKYRRPIIKSSKFPMYFTPIEFVSRKNNRYLKHVIKRIGKEVYYIQLFAYMKSKVELM